MNRRRFIGLACVSAVALKAINTDSLFSEVQGEISSKVFEIASVSDNSFKKMFEMYGGISSFLKKDIKLSTVLIKPNLTLPHSSEKGTITPSKSVEELCKALISFGVGKIIIADHTLLKSSDFEKIEYFEIPKKYPQVKLFLANEERHFEKISVSGKVLKETMIMKFIPKADLFINYANAKHHSATNVSLSIKNLMGCIWDRTEFHTKMDLHQAIAELSSALKPDLNIIDTSYVLLNGGPTGPGPVTKYGSVFFSRNMLNLDSILTSKFNFGGKSLVPKDVKHLQMANLLGIGEINPEKIRFEKL